MSQIEDTELALLVDGLMRRIHFGLQTRAPGFDRRAVGPMGGVVLLTLSDMGRTGLAELTRRVARDKSQMTRAVRSLETKELVKREASPEDGRVTDVYLTEDGEQVVRELIAAVTEVVSETLEPISAAEKQTLKSLLQRILS